MIHTWQTHHALVNVEERLLANLGPLRQGVNLVEAKGEESTRSANVPPAHLALQQPHDGAHGLLDILRWIKDRDGGRLSGHRLRWPH